MRWPTPCRSASDVKFPSRRSFGGFPRKEVLAAGTGLALLAGCSPPEPLRPGDLLLASERPGDGAPVRTGAPVVSGVAWPLPNRIADTLAHRMAPDESPPKARRALAREIEPVLLRVRRAFPEAGVPILESVVPDAVVVVLEADLAAAVRRLLGWGWTAAPRTGPVLLRTGNAAFDSFNERNGLSRVSVLGRAKFLFHFDHPVDFDPSGFELSERLFEWWLKPSDPMVQGFPRFYLPYRGTESGAWIGDVREVHVARYDLHGDTAGYGDTHRNHFGSSLDVKLKRLNGTWCLEVQEFSEEPDWPHRRRHHRHRFAVEGDKVERVRHGQAHKCEATFARPSSSGEGAPFRAPPIPGPTHPRGSAARG